MGGFRHLFGPVPSRRLGLSLGVDLVPPKTCLYDCLFCQISRTLNPTLNRAEFVPVREVLTEFERWLAEGGRADHLTLAGAGEPTLHIRFGDVLQGLRDRSAIPTVLLSNGALLFLPEVREAARLADIVKVSWSAWDESSWRRINRPHPNLTFAQVSDGIRRFAASCPRQLWVEVFIVPGINDSLSALRALAEQVNALGASRIHLNTATRPPADSAIRPASIETLRQAALLFRPAAEIPDISPSPPKTGPLAGSSLPETLRRHPATAAQLAQLLERPEPELAAELDALAHRGVIRRIVREGQIWYGPPD